MDDLATEELIGSRDEIETLKMQKKQSKVMELVKQASASPNANALTSILVQATSHPQRLLFLTISRPP
ncbi:hypothetical protein GYH30_024716 [Glycine max]|nr:hypothetical protein GYH30_024716 [Glycine max]